MPNRTKFKKVSIRQYNDGFMLYSTHTVCTIDYTVYTIHCIVYTIGSTVLSTIEHFFIEIRTFEK